MVWGGEGEGVGDGNEAAELVGGGEVFDLPRAADDGHAVTSTEQDGGAGRCAHAGADGSGRRGDAAGSDHGEGHGGRIGSTAVHRSVLQPVREGLRGDTGGQREGGEDAGERHRQARDGPGGVGAQRGEHQGDAAEDPGTQRDHDPGEAAGSCRAGEQATLRGQVPVAARAGRDGFGGPG